MKDTIKMCATVLLCFFSLIGIMKLLVTLNKGNLMLNTLAIVGIVFLITIIIKSRMFTKNPFK